MTAYGTYAEVSERLNAIVNEVNAEGITLDEALALYEEAVKLGLHACDLSEEDAEAFLAADEAAGAEAASAPNAEAPAAPAADAEPAAAAQDAPAASNDAPPVGEPQD